MRLPQPEHSTAILIGVADYRDPALPDIPATANNVADLAATLTDPDIGGFLAKNVHSLVNPTHTEAGRRVARLCRDADDVLLVYFAGHGLIAKDGELLLAVSDTEEDLPGVSSLPIGHVREAISESPASTRILILDCCFSGRAATSLMSDADAALRGQVEVQGTYTLTSAPRNLPSVFIPGAQHTVFTGELITVLRDGVPDGTPLLSLRTVHSQLVRRMRLGNHPRPHVLHSDSASELALVRNRSYRPESIPPPPQPIRLPQPEPETFLAALESLLPAPEPPPPPRSLVEADAIIRNRSLEIVEGEAVNPRWPILARLRFACALIENGRRSAGQALQQLGSTEPLLASMRIANMLKSLHNDATWVEYAGTRWNLDGLLARNTSYGDPPPAAVWGTAMAMLLDAAKLPIPICTKAIAELADLGYPEQAACIAEGMLRDSWLDEAAAATLSQLTRERQ
jgi:hypothetical protein